MEKKYKLPPIVWLKVTDYMHGWMQWELGGGARVGEQRVVCVQHLPGAREVLRMETLEDMMEPRKVGCVMSGTRRLVVNDGMEIDEVTTERLFGVTRAQLKLFAPIECPRMCLTKNGVLRPWTLNVCLGREQAQALMKVIRAAFWQAVEDFDREYARKLGGGHYPAVDMIEAFCKHTHTPDVHVEAMRREWQRRRKTLNACPNGTSSHAFSDERDGAGGSA